jgi:hypothetical protein
MGEIYRDIVEEVLQGFSINKIISCPICRATIDCIGQELESDSNFYYCANCGFSIKR